MDVSEGLQYAERGRNYAINSTPVIVKNVIIAGANIQDLPQTKEQPRGDIFGFDVETGKKLWTFHSIPRKGEFGYESWEGGSAEYTGGTNVWSMLTVDEDLGYVYLPFGTPTNDYYGGHRLGDNLFAESLVCLDARTGKRVWHFQAVHHGLWDYDFPTAPILVDITVNGRRINAVAQVSKQGFVYVFDRRTGEPVWPIEERPVPQSSAPGERTAKTQPFPTKPPSFDRQSMLDDDVVDFTPELRAQALEVLKQWDRGPLFTPPSERGTVQMPGHVGGADWGGAGVDPVSGMLFVPSLTSPIIVPLTKGDPARGNLQYRAATQQTADARWDSAVQAAVQPGDGVRPQHRYDRVAGADRRRAAQSPAAEAPEPGTAGQRPAGGASGHVDVAVHRAMVGRIGPRAGLEGWRS